MPGLKPLRLESALHVLVNDLEEKGILKQVDRQSLVNKTMENLQQAWDQVPQGDEIKNPMMLLKLTAALVASDKLAPGNAVALIKNLSGQINENQLKFNFDKLTDALQLDDPNSIKQFILLMRKLLQDAKKYRNENPPSKQEEQDNTFMGEYAADGTLINLIEGVFGNSKAANILTLDEEMAMGKPEHSVSDQLIDKLRSQELADRMKPTPPGIQA